MKITPRKKQMICLLALSNRRIAELLDCTIKNVEKTLADLYVHADVTSKTALLVWALKQGHVNLEDVQEQASWDGLR